MLIRVDANPETYINSDRLIKLQFSFDGLRCRLTLSDGERLEVSAAAGGYIAAVLEAKEAAMLPGDETAAPTPEEKELTKAAAPE